MSRRIGPFLLILIWLATSCLKEKGPSHNSLTEVPVQSDFHYLITISGDSMLTGVPIPATGKWVNPDSIAKPRPIPLQGRPKVEKAPTNKVPGGTPKVVPVPDQLEVIIPGENGIPHPRTVPAKKGKVVPVVEPPPVRASLPKMRDLVTADFRYLTMDEGMASNRVRSLLQDSRGNLWIGTGAAVSKYDGSSFTHYDAANGLSGGYIQAIMEDSKGNLWFGTTNGATRYDGNYFYHYTTQEGLIHNVVTCILEDRQGNIWFGTFGGGVCKYSPNSGRGSFIHYTVEEGLSNAYILSIMEDSKGNIWLGTRNKGVVKFNGIGFTHYTVKEGLNKGQVRSIMEDSEGNIWFSLLGGGACRFDGKRFTHYTTETGLGHNGCRITLEDQSGNFWFGMRFAGLDKFDGKYFTNYSNQEGLWVHGNIWTMLKDGQGNFWIGSVNNGISRFDDRSFIHFPNFAGANAIIEDDQGHLWFGTHEGVIKHDGENITHYTTKEGLSHPVVLAILQDRQGNFWFGTNGGGISKFDPYDRGGTFTNYTVEHGLSGNSVHSIYEDSKGDLWFEVRPGGVNKYDGKSFTYYDTSNGLTENNIGSILEDSKGNMWFGSVKGATKFDGINFTHYTTREGLFRNGVSTILEDSLGNLWFGAIGGLSRYDGERFTHFTKEEGLSPNRMFSLVESPGNKIVATAFRDISFLVPSSKTYSGAEEMESIEYRIYNYAAADGLKKDGFRNIPNSVCLDSQGRLWWGTQEGITMLDLNKFELPATPPKINLDRIEIAQTFVDYRSLSDTSYQHSLFFGKDLVGTFDSVVAFHNYPSYLALPYKLRNLSFHLSTLDWAAPHKLRYRFLLEGLEKDWSPLTSDNRASYQNLPPGKYTFKAMAIGSARVWSDIFQYDFRILPPWWLSWWAYSLYTIAALSLLSGLFLYQRRRYQLQARLQLEQEKAGRLREMDQFKNRFYTNITHEFRTPLTVIKGMADQIRNQDKVKDLIRRNSNQLLSMINQLLNLSKLESNSLPIHWVQTDIIPFLQYLTESCHSLAEKKKLNLAFFSKEGQLVMDFDEIKLQQILINLLSNAIKFTPVYGSIKVIASKVVKGGQACLELTVQDTGQGIPAEQLPHIFDRFYQIDDSTTRRGKGSGIGLALVRELVHLFKGQIEVESEEGRGSTFVVYLPVHQKAAKKEKVDLVALPLAVLASDSFEESPTTTPLPADDEKPQVLIIEDNADVREYILSCLKPDYALQTARNGKEGLKKALEYIPDVILCDVMMPEMDGFEVCRRLKADRRSSHIPIVLLTAKATQEDKITGLAQGADAYLTKPFDKEELLIRLRNLSAQSQRLRERLADVNLVNEKATKAEQQEATFLLQLDEIIESNLDNELFNTHYLCRAIGMSRSQLHRKLRALRAQSTAGYIRSVRLQKAKSLLETTDQPIGDIALLVGYKDFSHFSRSFKKEFGSNPSEIRK